MNASPASCKLSKQFTEGESCITALDVDIDGRVVVVGDINGEIHGYLTDDALFGKRQCARIFKLDWGHAHGETLWSVHLDDARYAHEIRLLSKWFLNFFLKTLLAPFEGLVKTV